MPYASFADFSCARHADFHFDAAFADAFRFSADIWCFTLWRFCHLLMPLSTYGRYWCRRSFSPLMPCADWRLMRDDAVICCLLFAIARRRAGGYARCAMIFFFIDDIFDDVYAIAFLIFCFFFALFSMLDFAFAFCLAFAMRMLTPLIIWCRRLHFSISLLPPRHFRYCYWYGHYFRHIQAPSLFLSSDFLLSPRHYFDDDYAALFHADYYLPIFCW